MKQKPGFPSLPIERIVIETTGGYEHDFVEAAIDKRFPIVISNFLRVLPAMPTLGDMPELGTLKHKQIAALNAMIREMAFVGKNLRPTMIYLDF